MSDQPRREAAVGPAAPWLLAGLPLHLCGRDGRRGGPAAEPSAPSGQRDPGQLTESGRTLLRFATGRSGTMGEARWSFAAGRRVAVSRGSFSASTATLARTPTARRARFTWHEAHQHIHFDGFARYLLRPITIAGSAREFCRRRPPSASSVLDVRKINGSLLGRRERPGIARAILRFSGSRRLGGRLRVLSGRSVFRHHRRAEWRLLH